MAARHPQTFTSLVIVAVRLSMRVRFGRNCLLGEQFFQMRTIRRPNSHSSFAPPLSEVVAVRWCSTRDVVAFALILIGVLIN